MVKYLKNYIGESRIFVVSASAGRTAELLENGVSVGEILDGRITFLPDGYSVTLDEGEREEFGVFHENDVLEITDTGIIYRWYSDREGDAGIATTERCNSNCIMCPAGDSERKRTDIPIEKLKTIIRYMPDDIPDFTITGGEPTLIGEDHFLEIYRTAVEHFPDSKLLLLTNGRTLGDRAFFERFRNENTERLRVAIPLHGSTAEKHDGITRSPGGFDQTLRGMENMIRAGIELEIRIVISRLNCEDLYDIAALIVHYFPKVKIVHFIGLEMRGNCAVNADRVVISYEEAFGYAKEAIRYLMRQGIDVALYNFPYCMIKKEYWPLARKSISAYKAEFYDECEACSLREWCCGIFTATKAFYKPKVYPIIKGVEDGSVF